VGKSTLFNRLVGRRQAIVDSTPGITRDRIEGGYEWEGRSYRVSDLAGWDEGPDNPFANEIFEQINRISKEADVLLLMVDGQTGLTDCDREIAAKLRASKSPIIVVVNKCDTVQAFGQAVEFYELGLGDPIPISATHNLNVDELLDRIAELTADLRIPEIKSGIGESVKVAIVGHQNAGKSTLFNALVGDKRAIVSDIPGTTRDSVDTAVEIDGTKFIFTDTAGLKKRTRIREDVDFYASKRTQSALARSDIALLLIDATEGVTDTDMKIAGFIQETQRACVIIASKWDESEDAPGHRETFIKHVTERIHFLSHTPVIFTSGLYNEGTENVFPALLNVHKEFTKQVPTSEWNRALQDAVTSRPPPTVKGKQLKLNYITQTGIAPPTLTIFVNQPEFLKDQYKRYLLRQFRNRFGFDGSPLVLNVRRKAVKRTSSVV